MPIRKIAAAACAASIALAAVPASAQAPQGASEALARVQAGEVATGYAQYRQYYRASPYGYQQPYVYERRTYVAPRRYYRRDRGNAAAAGIAGLAAGAIIGGAIASQQAQAAPQYVAPDQSAVAYCMQRFRSYDPRSGTYMGYDGVRRRCP